MKDDSPFYIARFTPTSDTREALEVAVPTDCVSIPSEGLPAEERGLFAPLALFVSTNERILQLSIYDSVLPREISAGDLAEVDAKYRDVTLIQRRDLGNHEAEIITSFTHDDEPWIGRSKIVISRNLAFRAEAAAPSDCDPNIASDCAKSVMSFRLSEPDIASSVEPLIDREFQSPSPGGGFRYPASWFVSADSTEPGIASCSLDNLSDGECVGRIKVIVWGQQRKALPAEHVREFADELMDAGIVLSGAPVVPIDPPAGFLAASTYMPHATENGEDRSAGAVLLEHQNANALIGVFGRGKRTAPLWWAINKRAFEIVRDSLRVHTT